MRKSTQHGYSLVEVLIALAITSIVLLTVVTLFYMGRRNVYSGKQTTYAVSVGTRMMEDLSAMTAGDLMNNFNIDDSTTTANVTITGIAPGAPGGTQTIAASVKRDSTTCTTANPAYPATPGAPRFLCANDPSLFLAKWNDLIDQSKLTNAEVGLVITPRDPSNVARVCPGGNCPWLTARYLKVRAYISWEEAKNRRRLAIYDTTKVNRQ